MQKTHYKPGLVSVILPTYNYAKFLTQALDSALSQVNVDLEVIVVDDGSTDKTPEVLARYDNLVTYVRQRNKGLSAARNAGLALARGEFFVILDADDLLMPGVLASQRSFLQRDPKAGMAVCRSYFFEVCDELGHPQKSGEWHLFKQNLDIHLYHFNIAPPHAFMFHRQVWETIGSFDATLKACEDHDFWFRAASAGFRPIANLEGLVFYRQHANSMSRNLVNQRVHDAILHERIASAIDNKTHNVTGFIERPLACIAGCLLTANRLQHERPDISASLRELSLNLVHSLGVLAPITVGTSILAEYFILRIYMSLAEPFQMNSTWAQDIVKMLQSKIPSLTDSLKALTQIEIQNIAKKFAMEKLIA